MSWLFCCGGSQAQKQKELQATVDLSTPIRAPGTLAGENKDEIDALAGDFSHQDHQFTRIINKGENQDQSVDKSRSQGLPLSQEALSADPESGRSTEQKLNNYLQQTSKLVQKKEKRKGTEPSYKHSTNTSGDEEQWQKMTNPKNKQQNVGGDRKERGQKKEHNNSNKLFTNNQEHKDNNIYEDGYMNQPKSKAQQRQRAFTNTASQSNTVVIQPKSTKHESDKKFTLNQYIDNSEDLEEQKVYKSFNKKPSLGSKQNQKTSKENTRILNDKKIPKNKHHKNNLEIDTSNQIGLTRNSEPVNYISDKYTSASGEKEDIFPSAQSAFCFQPKYFKPSTTKNQEGSKQDGSGVEGSQLGSRIFEKSPQALNSARNSKGAEPSFTPTYSGSSTIVSNSRNPSIVPKEQKTAISTMDKSRKGEPKIK